MNEKLEHPLDRLKRFFGDRLLFRETEDGFWHWDKKCRGRRVEWWVKNPVTMLFTCDICGKTSTPKKVSHRNDVYGWNLDGKRDYGKSKSCLCMGCWNKIRPIVKREEEAEEMEKFINQVKKEITNERKNQNDRRNARLFGNDDGRREERRP